MCGIILQGFILVAQDQLDEIKAALQIHIELTRQEPGCRVFEVTQDEFNPAKFHVYEEFIDQNAFDQHQARVKSSEWGKVSAAAQRHYSISSKS